MGEHGRDRPEREQHTRSENECLATPDLVRQEATEEHAGARGEDADTAGGCHYAADLIDRNTQALREEECGEAGGQGEAEVEE